jgi:predicted outer membrane repeat protein
MQGVLTVVARAGAVLLAFLCGCACANTCRVTTSGSAANDGSTWPVPMDLQTALGNPACTEVWVAAGAYKPTSDTNRLVYFHVQAGVAVYGGFAGGETQRTQRNPGLNVTTLSGDIGVAGVRTDNSNTIVKMIASAGATITASTVLDGFTISDAYYGGNGGGLYCNGSGAGNECSPTLANLVFNNDAAVYGGAIYNDGHNGGVSNPTLTNITFNGNVSVNDGGAVYNDGSNGTSNPVLNGVTFSGNSTDGGDGGAMYDQANSGPALNNVTFSGNGGDTTVFGAAHHTFLGGAIYTRTGGAPTLNNVTFSGNSANDGGAIYITGAVSLQMSNVVLWGDLVLAGGTQAEILNNLGTVTITSSVVQGGGPAGCTCIGVIDSDPLLGPLKDNGGPTQTMLPTSGGSAIDGGYNPTCAPKDQRGVPRPQGANCDVGAVEVVLDRIFADNLDGRPTP